MRHCIALFIISRLFASSIKLRARKRCYRRANASRAASPSKIRCCSLGFQRNEEKWENRRRENTRAYYLRLVRSSLILGRACFFLFAIRDDDGAMSMMGGRSRIDRSIPTRSCGEFWFLFLPERSMTIWCNRDFPWQTRGFAIGREIDTWIGLVRLQGSLMIRNYTRD